MINAATAIQISDAYYTSKEHFKLSLAHIEEQIIEAAEQGFYSIEVYDPLFTEDAFNQEIFVDNGFKVQTTLYPSMPTGKIEPKLTISWEK